LERRIAMLETRVKQLKQLQIESALANKRQAVPFSRNQLRAYPDRPKLNWETCSAGIGVNAYQNRL
jgi:hypothetical protein